MDLPSLRSSLCARTSISLGGSWHREPDLHGVQPPGYPLPTAQAVQAQPDPFPSLRPWDIRALMELCQMLSPWKPHPSCPGSSQAYGWYPLTLAELVA